MYKSLVSENIFNWDFDRILFLYLCWGKHHVGWVKKINKGSCIYILIHQMRQNKKTSQHFWISSNFFGQFQYSRKNWWKAFLCIFIKQIFLNIFSGFEISQNASIFCRKNYMGSKIYFFNVPSFSTLNTLNTKFTENSKTLWILFRALWTLRTHWTLKTLRKLRTLWTLRTLQILHNMPFFLKSLFLGS